MAHALSLGRVDQRGLLDLMLLFLAGWSASAPWDSLLALVGSVVGSRVPFSAAPAAYKGWTPFQGGWGGGPGLPGDPHTGASHLIHQPDGQMDCQLLFFYSYNISPHGRI